MLQLKQVARRYREQNTKLQKEVEEQKAKLSQVSMVIVSADDALWICIGQFTCGIFPAALQRSERVHNASFSDGQCRHGLIRYL